MTDLAQENRRLTVQLARTQTNRDALRSQLTEVLSVLGAGDTDWQAANLVAMERQMQLDSLRDLLRAAKPFAAQHLPSCCVHHWRTPCDCGRDELVAQIDAALEEAD